MRAWDQGGRNRNKPGVGIAMFLQFVLVVVMAISGLASPAPQLRDSSLRVSSPQERVLDRVASGASTTSSIPAGVSGARADGVVLKDLDIAVPPVESSDKTVKPGGPLEPQLDMGVVVADQLVTPKRVESEVVKTAGFQTLGVTWPENAKVGGLGGQVRTRTHGNWSGWVDLEPIDHAPDPGTAEAARAVRSGTDPISIGDAEAVQLAFTASAQGGPKGMSLALVGSSEKPVSGGVVGSTAGAEVSIEPAAYTPALVQAAPAPGPAIITRAQWGAPAQACKPDVVSKLVGAIVHHTAGPNTYTNIAQAKRQIRNDAVYHISRLGWCDIGYNFIVDKWGNIYEGRAGSRTQAIVGAHAGGFNSGTVGVSMLGTYGGAPSAATQRSVAQVIGWRLGAYGVNPMGSMVYRTGDGGVGARYRNKSVRLPRVSGHRDVWFTACPGNGGYAALRKIRVMAQHPPFGSLDTVKSAPGVISVRGWALDPDTTASIRVHIYVDGKARASLPAASLRPDIGRIFRRGDSHGFSGSVRAANGRHQVCVYAIDSSGGSNRRIGCRAVRVTNLAPIGIVDSVTWSEGRLLTHGWALDRDTAAPIRVHVYVDGRATLSILADTSRPDVGRIYGRGDNHGFGASLNALAGTHEVCVYAIDASGGTKPRIGCQSVVVPG